MLRTGEKTDWEDKEIQVLDNPSESIEVTKFKNPRAKTRTEYLLATSYEWFFHISGLEILTERIVTNMTSSIWRNYLTLSLNG